ncbi:MAG: outer membrane beta-barrel protein [Saprospiraceae bacterium]
MALAAGLVVPIFANAQVPFTAPVVTSFGPVNTLPFQSAPPSDFSSNLGYGSRDNSLSNIAEGLAEGIFSKLPVHLTLSAREGYDSNVFTTQTDPIGSFYSNVSAGTSYDFGSPRFRLNSNLNGGATYYYSRPGDSVDLNGSVGLSATYLATPRLTLGFSTTTAYLSQPDLTILGATNRQNGDYFYSNTTLTANYQLTPIFSTTSAYNINAIYYLDSNLNDQQGNISQSFSESFNWLWKPTTTLFVNYTANPTTYYQADLNQFANYFAAGFTQILNPRSTWTARLGAQVNFNKNPTDGESIYVGPYGETTLNYMFGPSSSIFLTMRYGTEASGIDNVTQRQTFRVALGVNHNFSPRLSASLNLNYLNNYYSQSGVVNAFDENIFEASASLNYQLNRLTSLSLGYQYTVDSAPGASYRDYTRNVIFGGANFSF